MISFFLKESKIFRGLFVVRNSASETGRSETALVKEALDHYLDDLEDIYFSNKVVQRIRDGREDVVSSEEMAQMLGLKSEGSR